MLFSTHNALRYVAPLREGGSLPGIVETEAGLFATKFRGAGQGARALLAELIAGGIAEVLGLPLPEVALIEAHAGFGRAEPDAEIQDILKGSVGLNVGLGFIDGAFPYDPVAVGDLVPPDLAAEIIWMDALITNIDRTARNPNLLVAGDDAKLWLIDHGAALYFHHNWEAVDEARARAPFVPIKDHVLLPASGDIAAADARLAPRLTEDTLHQILASVPDDLFMDAPEGRTAPFETPEANREAYATFFRQRLLEPREWVAEAIRARATHTSGEALPYRR